ncbi:hypothetical protein HJC22_21800 [Corallococcus exiguus]|uniref:hypothetical protein n=1 Tax=Corallococcus exiguus TaxID=83462 RepID=UPI001470DE3F|nr:hypothetical protein [Corallococcus exiguus]NNC18350.1 hypothetical protein [Corallococcus exiguus]
MTGDFMGAKLVHPIPPPPRGAMAALWEGWIPAWDRLAEEPRGIEWINEAGRFQEGPFYDESIALLLQRHPRIGRNVSSPATVHQVAEAIDGLSPSGFIFHMSRCGSTLVQNALRCLDGTLVPGEPDVLSSLLLASVPGPRPRGASAAAQAERDALLRSLVKVFGRRRTKRDRRLFIKFASLETVRLDVVRRLWPDVPWLFIYRDPVDVVVSNMARPSGWMDRPTPEQVKRYFGWGPRTVDAMTREEYCARAISHFCGVAADSADAKAHLLNYEDIDLERLVAVMDAFGVHPTRAERARVEKSLRVYSKDPRGKRRFIADTALKRRIAGPAVHDAVKQWALPAYRLLNRHRRRIR